MNAQTVSFVTGITIIIAALIALLTGHLTETAFVALIGGGAAGASAGAKIGESKK